MEKIEKRIFEKISELVKKNPDLTPERLEKEIVEEIKNKNYLNKKYQIHYAKERIKRKIRKESENWNFREKKDKGLNFLFLFSLIIIFLYVFGYQSQESKSIFSLIGRYIGFLVLLSIIASIFSLIPYFLTPKKRRTSNNYFKFFGYIFFVCTIFFIVVNLILIGF